MTYEILETGSSGNGTVVNGHILIDCGVSMKLLRPYLKGLDMVLLTHRHCDHFRESTVRGLHKARPTVRFVCAPWMAKPLMEAGVAPRSIDVVEPVNGEFHSLKWYRIGPTAHVAAVPLVHNVPNCAWVIYEQNKTLFYATDTGSLDGIYLPYLDLYLVEANHTEAELEARQAAELEAGKFSYAAAAAVNHLSRERASEWLMKNMGPRSRYRFMHQHIDRGGE